MNHYSLMIIPIISHSWDFIFFTYSIFIPFFLCISYLCTLPISQCWDDKRIGSRDSGIRDTKFWYFLSLSLFSCWKIYCHFIADTLGPCHHIGSLQQARDNASLSSRYLPECTYTVLYIEGVQICIHFETSAGIILRWELYCDWIVYYRTRQLIKYQFGDTWNYASNKQTIITFSYVRNTREIR